MSKVSNYSDFGDMLNSPADLYNAIESHAFKDWSDGSKSGFFNYLTAERSNQHEIDMWNLQNDYNSPANQVARLSAAGLNPNLFYNSVNSGNNSSAPGTHTPTFAFNDKQQKMQKTQMILSAIQEFAQGVMNLVDTGTQLYDNYKYRMPIHQNQLAMSSNEAFLSNQRLEALRNMTSGNKAFYESQGVNLKDLIPMGEFNGEMYYLHTPIGGQYIPDIINEFQKIGGSSSNQQYLQDYRQHMRNTFKSDESLRAAQAAIQGYIAEFEKNVPREFRWLMPILFQIFRLF